MAWEPKLQVIELTDAEELVVAKICEEALDGAAAKPLAEIILTSALHAQALPFRVRQAFYSYKLAQTCHAICIRTSAPADEGIGPTPSRYRPVGELEMVGKYDVMHLMFASLLGEPFAWSTIQNGYVFNDIIPIRHHADRPASSGFMSDFGLHTEDAFHPWAGDYLGLACLRNSERVPTTLAGFETEELSVTLRDILFEPRFIVGANVAQEVEPVMISSPILFGDENDPYMRINMNATSAVEGDHTASAALREFGDTLVRNITGVVFQPGDFWYIDNLRVAHGREKYKPRFDGRDRWLRRLYISSAYRYTRGLREKPSSRVLDPSRRQWSVTL